ncbi:MAG: SRPBCC family protein [Spirochaetia bacterium]|nr:SRPBCC family protein [Spirochaetia bacterium]
MPLIKNLLLVIVIITGLLFGISLFLPSKWEVKRSAIIHASADAVFPFINDLHRWSQWYPWTRDMDVSMVSIYEGSETGVGSIKKWTGSDIKNGRIEIVKSLLNREVHYVFKSDQSKMIVYGSLVISKPEPGDVKITWTDRGDTGWSLLARFSAGGIDEAIGKKFDEGLNKLKKIAEETSVRK